MNTPEKAYTEMIGEATKRWNILYTQNGGEYEEWMTVTANEILLDSKKGYFVADGVTIDLSPEKVLKIKRGN
jgi:hypothetical protein